MWKSSSVCFVKLEKTFRDSSLARIVYLSTKPDESLKVKGLKACSELKDDKIVFKAACRRGVMSLAYTLYEYLQHIMLIENAVLTLEEAKCP